MPLQNSIERAWYNYASARNKTMALSSLEGVIMGSVFPVNPEQLKSHQQDWPLLLMLLKYYVPFNLRDLRLKESLVEYFQKNHGNATEWALMEKLLLGLPDTSLEMALSPEQWKTTPWFHFHPTLAEELMGYFLDNPKQAIDEALFFPFSQRRPVLNEETSHKAFAHAMEKTQSGISYAALTKAIRLEAIQSTILSIHHEPENSFLRRKLEVLLGVPTAKAKAEAAQYFFNPLSALKRQLYWVILSSVQVIENQRLKNPDTDESDFAFQYRHLNALIERVFEVNLSIFPELKDFKQTWDNEVHEKKPSPKQYVMLAYQQCRQDAFTFAKDTLSLFPDNEDDLAVYSLAAIESIAFTHEKNRYINNAWDFFHRYPDQIPVFREIFSLSTDSLSVMIDQLASSPSLLGWQSPGRALMESTTDESLQQTLLAHGAYYARSSDVVDWSHLKNTLTVYVPQSFQDERFRERMQHYSDLSNHQDDRWSALMRALFVAKSTHTTFFEQAYREALKTRQSYRWDSRLLTMAQECHEFSSVTLHQSLQSLSQFEQTLAITHRLVPESPDVAQFIPSFANFFTDWLNQLPVRSFSILNLKQVTVQGFQPLIAHRPHLEGLWLDEQNLNFSPEQNTFYATWFSTSQNNPLFLALYRELPFLTALQDLSLRRTGLNDFSFQYLLPLLVKLPLKRLDLSENLLTDESLNALMKKQGSFQNTLMELDLSGNFFTDNSARALFKCLPHFPKLHTMEWGRNPAITTHQRERYEEIFSCRAPEQYPKAFWRLNGDSLSKQESLIRLSMDRTSTESLTEPSPARTLSYPSRLSSSFSTSTPTLNASFSSEPSDDDFTQPTEAMLASVTQAITHGTLRYCADENLLTDENFSDFLSCLKVCDRNLTVIDLQGQTFTPEAFKRLLKVLKRFESLKALHLDYVKLDTTVKINIFSDFVKKHPSLEKISLIGDEVIDAKLLKILKEAISENPRLKSIDFNGTSKNVYEIQAMLKPRMLGTILEDEDHISQISENISDSALPTQTVLSMEAIEIGTVIVEAELSNASLEISHINPGMGFMPASTREVRRHYVVVCEQKESNAAHSTADNTINHTEVANVLTQDNQTNPSQSIEDEPVEIFLVDFSKRTPAILPLTQQLTDFLTMPLWSKLKNLKNSERIERLTVDELNALQDFLDAQAPEESMETFVYATQSLNFNLSDSFESFITAQKDFLLPANRYPKRQAFFHGLVQGLQSKLSFGYAHDNSALSSGLAIADFAGTALAPTLWAKPALSSLTAMARQVNAIERQAFQRHIMDFKTVLNSNPEKIRRWIECMALMILTRYVHEFQEYELNAVLVETLIEEIINFIGFGHTSQAKLLDKDENEVDVFILNKIDRLMYALFESPECYFVASPAQWHRCLESLRHGVKIVSHSVAVVPLLKGSYVPSHYRFSEHELVIELRAFEQHFRQAILTAIDNYHRQHHDVGYYGRLFERYVKFHGGDKSFERAGDLAKKIRTLPFKDLLVEFLNYLNQTKPLSRLRQYSLNSQIMDVLVGNVDEDALKRFSLQLQETVALLCSNEQEDTMVVAESVNHTAKPSESGLFANTRKLAMEKIQQDLSRLKTNDKNDDDSTVMEFGSP